MMKSYSYLFLLLITVNTTVSAGFPIPRIPSSVKNYGKNFWNGAKQGYKWHKRADDIIDILSPPSQQHDLSPPAPSQQQGIHDLSPPSPSQQQSNLSPAPSQQEGIHNLSPPAPSQQQGIHDLSPPSPSQQQSNLSPAPSQQQGIHDLSPPAPSQQQSDLSSAPAPSQQQRIHDMSPPAPSQQEDLSPAPAPSQQQGMHDLSPPAPSQQQDQLSPAPAPSQQQEIKSIKGLSLIKQYLYDFGYIDQHSGSFGDTLDAETISAINTYQQNFNLQVTSDLNNETLEQMSLPRCGVPDMNFEYTFADTINVSWPKGKGWFEGKKNLTYSFAPQNDIPLNWIEVFRSALTRWSTTTKVINFTETESYDDANIKIGFYIYDEEVEDVVISDTLISLQLNSNVTSGVIRLDGSNYWILPTSNDTNWSWENGQFDLETVVMHQIGHLLGLNHSFEEDSIMYPTILPSQQRKVQLTVSDNETIHQLYTDAIKANANYGYVRSSSGFITSLFLGFALVAMLN